MISLNAMVAVQAPDGLANGAACGLDGEVLLFELESDLPIGGSVSFRLELPGLDDTIRGVLGHLGQARSETGRRAWTARIQELESSDREVFELWRAAAERGNRAMTHTRLTDVDGWARAGSMSGSTASERARAMAIDEERRKRRLSRARELASGKKVLWPDPHEDRAAEARELFSELSSATGHLGLRTAPPSTVTSPEPGLSGRASVAAVLRNRLNAARSASIPPEAGYRPPPLPPLVATSDSAVSEPAVDVRAEGVRVTWRTPAIYERDWRQNLRASALLLHQALTTEGSVRVTLTLPTGDTIHCNGDIVHRSPGATGLTLRLTPDDRARLRPPTD